jgi:hypothetical protein
MRSMCEVIRSIYDVSTVAFVTNGNDAAVAACVAHIGFALGWQVCKPLKTLMFSTLRSDLWLAVIEAVDACG